MNISLCVLWLINHVLLSTLRRVKAGVSCFVRESSICPFNLYLFQAYAAKKLSERGQTWDSNPGERNWIKLLSYCGHNFESIIEVAILPGMDVIYPFCPLFDHLY